MPVIRLCSRQGCGQHAMPNTHHCALHYQAERNRRATKTRTAGYATQHWQQLRRQALTLHPYCTNCGSSHDLTVHLAPHLHGNHVLATLQDCAVLCRACHGTIDASRAHKGKTQMKKSR